LENVWPYLGDRGAKLVETTGAKLIDLFPPKTYKKQIYGKIALGTLYEPSYKIVQPI